MSSVATCAHRLRRTRGDVLPGGPAPRQATARKSLRRGAAGVAAAGLVYVCLLLVTAGDDPLLDVSWVASTAETTRPYEATAADSLGAFGHSTAHVLSWIGASAPWPLMALTLFWLAGRDQTVYVRGALALFVSNAAGLAVFTSLRGFPADEASLVRDYFALTGVQAGWYLLMALAVTATTTRRWARATVTVIALSAQTAAAITTDHRLLGALVAAGVPLVAWYAAGSVQRGRGAERRSAVAASRATPRGHDVVPLRPRTEAPEAWAGAEPVRLRQAG
ncbi:hypothetical protein [Streptomyces blattellae]|uniref:hypothetical protein n=1 Tax=Streptomyces blattellae TaxID=2569855 RepID=UPI0012B77286|nr:hypothetical protein [Streptomyces blattellae]